MKTFYRALSRNKTYILTVVVAALLLQGCGDKEPAAGFRARVNDTYLTEEEFLSLSDSSARPSDPKELLQQWIKTEILYQQAQSTGILKDSNYISTIERAKKELAATMFLNKLVSGQEFSAGRQDVASYYAANQQEFMLQSPAIVYHIAYSKNEQVVDELRETAIKQGWNTVQKQYGNNASITLYLYRLKRDYELDSGVQSRVLTAMIGGETSLVMRMDSGLFFVAGIVESLEEGNVLPIEYVKGEIEKRVIDQKKNEFLESALQKMYAKSRIEIKN